MKKVLIILIALFSFGFASAQTGSSLQMNYAESWTDAEVADLVQKISNESTPNFQLNVLIKAVNARTEGFTASQTASVLKAFETSTFKAKAIAVMDEKIFGMTSSEIIGVLGQMPFPSHKLEVLEALRSCITDENNKMTILDAFATSRDKAAAKVILDKIIQPRSFIYGTVTSKRVVFVIDLSGSMEASFTTNNGQSYSRLAFVKMELAKALQSLDQSCKFNIIMFESSTRTWQQFMQQATPANIQSAMSFVSGLQTGGATDIYGGLQTAYNYTDCDRIYFLTDGMPTSGLKTNISEILADVAQWNQARNIKIYSTAFLMGDFGGDDKAGSRNLMRKLAEITGGVYRAIE